MDTAASTGSVGGQTTTGFAIPIDRALNIAHQIVDGKASSTIKIGASGFMGVLVPSGSASTRAARPSSSRIRPKTATARGGPGGRGLRANRPERRHARAVAPASSGTLILGELCGTPGEGGHRRR